LAAAPGAAVGQAPPVQIDPLAISDPLATILHEGHQLEMERRWSDALVRYEEALKEYPNNRQLSERLDLAKIHFNLARRYNDASFRRDLTALGAQQAVDLYGEVLDKIQTHYVTPPDWAQLVRRGATALDIALADDAFRLTSLATAPQDQIERFRQNLRMRTDYQEIKSQREAVGYVIELARAAERQIGLSPTATVLEYVAAAAGGLDTYSAYLTGDQLRDVYSQIEGNFVGVGIELKAVEKGLWIVDVIPASPAEAAGVRPDDVIVEVDGASTAGITNDVAAKMLQGPEGSSVVVTVSTPGLSPRRLSIRREHVEVPGIDGAEILDKEFGVAYIRIPSFQKTTSRDLDAALWNLHRDGMRSLIIDLRSNPGGLLTSAVEVVDKFVQNGQIVSTRGRNPQENYSYSAHVGGTWRMPLVVLIDGDSASASEIFAAAIADHRRGTIVGERSYGKGSVQGIFPLRTAGTGIRLTTAKFYSPSGQPISNVGVAANIVVHQTAKINETGDLAPISHRRLEDAVLQAGLQVARQQVAGGGA
jgi:carboxyl-terminal processing protease